MSSEMFTRAWERVRVFGVSSQVVTSCCVGFKAYGKNRLTCVCVCEASINSSVTSLDMCWTDRETDRQWAAVCVCQSCDVCDVMRSGGEMTCRKQR